MKISDVINPEDILLDLKPVGKTSLLKDISRHASTRTGIGMPEILRMLTDREKLGSTGLGDGIAIPHARIKGLLKPFGLAVRLARSCDFEAVDTLPVDLVCLLLVPSTMDTDHITILSRLARTLRNPEVAIQLRQAADENAFYAALIGPGAGINCTPTPCGIR
jgi:PTS system nitrogen regulatory IIA component